MGSPRRTSSGGRSSQGGCTSRVTTTNVITASLGSAWSDHALAGALGAGMTHGVSDWGPRLPLPIGEEAIHIWPLPDGHTTNIVTKIIGGLTSAGDTGAASNQRGCG